MCLFRKFMKKLEPVKKDESYVRKKLISEESTTEEAKREPSEERKTSAETDTEIKDEFSFRDLKLLLHWAFIFYRSQVGAQMRNFPFNK